MHFGTRRPPKTVMLTPRGDGRPQPWASSKQCLICHSSSNAGQGNPVQYFGSDAHRTNCQSYYWKAGKRLPQSEIPRVPRPLPPPPLLQSTDYPVSPALTETPCTIRLSFQGVSHFSEACNISWPPACCHSSRKRDACQHPAPYADKCRLRGAGSGHARYRGDPTKRYSMRMIANSSPFQGQSQLALGTQDRLLSRPRFEPPNTV